MLHQTAERFRAIAPAVDFWSLRVVSRSVEATTVRQDVPRPPELAQDFGVMITVEHGGGVGYAGTADVSRAGLAEAVRRAQGWAALAARLALPGTGTLPRPLARETRHAPEPGWGALGLAGRLELLQDACRRLKQPGGQPRDEVVDWLASLETARAESLLVSADGAEIAQVVDTVSPTLRVVASRGSETQTRTRGGGELARQGGLHALRACGAFDEPERVTEEALALLDAPDCPSGVRDLVLMPGQMALQIHESIGHAIELDRILGDERNYAGGSFVTLEMFGRYQYGSPLLNVVFDPQQPGQLASYAFDDEGSAATREHLIRDGVLLRPLGGAASQRRAELPGVACARASGWNRPPIDRMANVNLEPGASSLAAMLASIERGVLMDTNRSWSIDDRRNKFQFGCEHARLIEDGQLGPVVKNPNYRGISATFWRSLDAVGDHSTFRVLGTPDCGKGEPNQIARVGHAAPVCLFRAVDVFGRG